MSSKNTKSFLYFTAVLLFLVNVNNGKNSEKPTCQAETKRNTIIDIKASKANSSLTKVLEGLKLQDETMCKERCCSHSDCTLFVYYDSSKRPSNCFLLKCSPSKSCIRSSLPGSVVGVIERNNLIQASQVESSKLHTVSTVTSKDGVMLETTMSETPIGATGSTPQQLEQREESSNSSAHPGITTPVPTTAYHHSSASPTQVTTHRTTPNVRAKKVKHHTEDHDHTNKTSLIIALFFGILFLLAVIIIVGRPWWDFMQRPRYSKVDYLMNEFTRQGFRRSKLFSYLIDGSQNTENETSREQCRSHNFEKRCKE